MTGDKAIYLSSAYLAPVEYYMLLHGDRPVVLEQHDHYIKQTYRNRCRIASANGVQTLSIPIVKPDTPKALTRDIRIADHDNWQHLHWMAIVSAYNSTPFFEYYADDFAPFYEKKWEFLFDFNEALRETVCRLLDIQPRITLSSQYEKDLPAGADFRDSIHPKKPFDASLFKPYYQVFEAKLGFQPNLSIIDLLFNMGPEAVLYLASNRR